MDPVTPRRVEFEGVVSKGLKIQIRGTNVGTLFRAVIVQMCDRVLSLFHGCIAFAMTCAFIGVGAYTLVTAPYCFDSDVYVGGYCLNVTAPISVYPARPVDIGVYIWFIVWGVLMIPLTWFKARLVCRWWCRARPTRVLTQEELMRLAHVYDERAFLAQLQGRAGINIYETGAINVDSAIRLAGLQVEDWAWGKNGIIPS